MIQLNLIPDVKEKYLRTQRLKRMVYGGSLIAVVASVGVIAIFASIVYGAQKIQLNNADETIKKNTAIINGTQDLDKILTVQNQLNKLTGLHDDKAVVSRLFDYLPQITPNDVFINNLNIVFGQSANTVKISGTSGSLETINRFVDTLKFTKYTIDGSEEQKNAFTGVVLSSFNRENKEANYTINMVYNPELFNSASKSVTLIVPKQITTQSTTQRPGALFKQPEGKTK